jgi:hypothetical protein
MPARERRWAYVRFALGTAQILGATAALVLLVQTGFNSWSLGAAVIACTLTTVSVLLFGSRRPR